MTEESGRSSPALGFNTFPALADVDNRLPEEEAGPGQGGNASGTSLWAQRKELPNAPSRHRAGEGSKEPCYLLRARGQVPPLPWASSSPSINGA